MYVVIIFGASSLVLGGVTVTVDRLVGGRGVSICEACIGDRLISGPVGAAAIFTLGSDSSFDGRICGVVGTAMEFTLGSAASSDGRSNGVVGATVGATLGSDLLFDICGISFKNCGGATCWMMVAISINSFTVVFPYVRDGIVDFCACNMVMMSDAA